MAYYRNVFIHVTVLLLVNTYCFAQSELKGPGDNVCEITEESVTKTDSIAEENISFDLDITFCNTTLSFGKCTIRKHQDNNNQVQKVIKNTTYKCCDGFVQLNESCAPIHGIWNYSYLGELCGILLLIVIVVFLLLHYFCIKNTRSADITHGKHALTPDPNSDHNLEHHAADRYQKFLNKLQTAQDINIIEAGHLMEAGMASSMIVDNNDTKSSAIYESIDHLNSDVLFVEEEVTKIQNQKNMYSNVDSN